MAYKPGDVVPESGIYRVTHDPKHAAAHQVTCIEGKKFPRVEAATIQDLFL
jgi:hypothetical protein